MLCPGCGTNIRVQLPVKSLSTPCPARRAGRPAYHRFGGTDILVCQRHIWNFWSFSLPRSSFRELERIQFGVPHDEPEPGRPHASIDALIGQPDDPVTAKILGFLARHTKQIPREEGI